MKNFDEARDKRRDADRTFLLGGETFVRVVGITPEQLFAYDDMKPGLSSAEVMSVMDDTLMEFIEDIDGAHDRYRALRLRKEHPLTMDDIVVVVKWLIEESTGHPTDAPESSLPGRDSTELSSEARASSRGQLRTI